AAEARAPLSPYWAATSAAIRQAPERNLTRAGWPSLAARLRASCRQRWPAPSDRWHIPRIRNNVLRIPPAGSGRVRRAHTLLPLAVVLPRGDPYLPSEG